MLPTWVPDWRNKGSIMMLISLPSGAYFSATRGIIYNFTALNYRLVFLPKGHLIKVEQA
jgi:hypothetical protein